MRFEHDNITYAIEFQREHKGVRIGVDRSGADIAGKSRFPYTTVTVYKVHLDASGKSSLELFRTATVGCHHNEIFTHEKGRLNALRLVSKTLSKEMKRKVWGTYMNRPKAK